MAVLAVICSLQKIYKTPDTVSEPCHKWQDLWPIGKLNSVLREHSHLKGQNSDCPLAKKMPKKNKRCVEDATTFLRTVNPPAWPLQLCFWCASLYEVPDCSISNSQALCSHTVLLRSNVRNADRAVENSLHLSQVVFLQLLCFSLGRDGRFSCCRLCYKSLSALISLGVSVTRVNLVYAGKQGGRITTPL